MSLFDHLSPPADPPRVLKRLRSHPCSRYLRKALGNRIQFRPWCPPYGNVNLGLYRSEEDAEKVYALWITEMRGRPNTPLGFWQALIAVLDGLITRHPGSKWPRPLPMWVYRVERGYAASGIHKGVMYSVRGPFRTPEAAHRKLVREMAAGSKPVTRRRERMSLLEWCSAG